jgi:hypothetical protein
VQIGGNWLTLPFAHKQTGEGEAAPSIKLVFS